MIYTNVFDHHFSFGLSFMAMAMATFFETIVNTILLNKSHEDCWKSIFLFIGNESHLRKIFKSGSLFRFALLYESASFLLSFHCVFSLPMHLFPSNIKIRTIFFPRFQQLHSSPCIIVDFPWWIYGGLFWALYWLPHAPL